MGLVSDASLLRAVDAMTLRATIAPPVPRVTAAQGLIDADGDALVSWITAVWGEVELAAAVDEASPDLARQVRSVVDGSDCDLRRLRRTALALARYEARWRGRATPFGLFAGVAPVRLGDRTEVIWTGRHLHHRSADGRWLADVICRLEADPSVRSRLTVVRNDLAMPCGDRLVVPLPSGRGERARSVSVRLTTLVARLLDAADFAVEVGPLTRVVAGKGADAGAVEDVVAVLLRCGALISCLTPPSTVTDGAAYVLKRLRSLPGGVPGSVAALVDKITTDVARQPTEPDQSTTSATAATVTGQRTDVRLGCVVTLPVAVADEAARAAETLLRFSPAPTGHPAWRRFHARFLDRFGTGAVVALTDALDSVTGVGLPQHLTEDEEPGTEQHALSITSRDRFVL